MTVSSGPDDQTLKPAEQPLSPNVPEDAPKLPGVLFLLRDACVATWKLRVVLYGYAAWLLIPLIIFVFTRNLPAPYADYLVIFENALNLLLALWVTAAIILYVAVVVTKDDHETIDFTALGKRAWEKVLGLFVVQAVTTCLIMFGTLLFILPGILVWVWTTFAVQEHLLSSRGIVDNFKTSRELVRGRFLPILGRLVVANLVFLVFILTAFALYVAAGLWGSAAELVPTLYAWPDWLDIGLSLISLPLLPVTVIFHLLLYFAVKKSYSAANV